MLKIFINTWGNYNENGADGGRWVNLPMDEDDLNEVLEDIAEKMGDQDPEFFINDFEWDGSHLREVGEMENIHDLNNETEILDNLSKWEMNVYRAAIEVWGHQYVNLDDLDNYNLYEDIECDYDLGYYWAIGSGCYNLDKMGRLASYIDFEAFGRDIRFETDGDFSSLGWIEKC